MELPRATPAQPVEGVVMIKLFTFPEIRGTQMSPPCAKVETYLKLVQQPYTTMPGWDTRKAPKGKFPYIEDGDRVVADSTFVIEYLKGAYGDALDGNLTSEQEAAGHNLRRMIEEGLYFVLGYARWLDPDGLNQMNEAAFSRLPPLQRYLAPRMITRTVKKMGFFQGTGRHKRDEIYWLGARDLDAMSDMLGDKPHFLGDKPTTADCSAFGMLGAILWSPCAAPLRDHAAGLDNLVAYANRMKDKLYWPRPETPA